MPAAEHHQTGKTSSASARIINKSAIPSRSVTSSVSAQYSGANMKKKSRSRTSGKWSHPDKRFAVATIALMIWLVTAEWVFWLFNGTTPMSSPSAHLDVQQAR
jgi:hypothetical protein